MGNMGDSTSAAPTGEPRRPVRIANCSGARGDPAYQMVRQATLGPVDFITGDYLAEMTLAENVEKMARGEHEGYEETAWAGLQAALPDIAARGIKVAINGGAQNPRRLAEKVAEFARARALGPLRVAYVYGDNRLAEVQAALAERGELPAHLDGANDDVVLAGNVSDLLDTKGKPVLSANAYLGARSVARAFALGADVVICGRVADASPVIGAAWYWHGWAETDYDALAGALIAGHLIECSSYVTGANYCGFDEFPQDALLDLSHGIAEVAHDGSCVVTKHDGTTGVVNVDTVRSQFLYEIQGHEYLNSDVTADTSAIQMADAGPSRVRVSGVHGLPPPPTTKLAIVYHGGYEAQILGNATGYATDAKWALAEAQMRHALRGKGLLDRFQLLDFQVLGVPAPDPRSQFASTTYGRWFVQAESAELVGSVLQTWFETVMQHFSGYHFSTDMRTAAPRPYQAFYPGVIAQTELKEGVVLLGDAPSDASATHAVAPPVAFRAPPARRVSYETADPVPDLAAAFGRTCRARLGDVIFGRSGDKGANINFGCFVRDARHYPWLQSFMTVARLQLLMADYWRDAYHVERVEFPGILAVHFVIYGPLGRGVSGSRLLDSLAKGFTDFIRDRVVDIPVAFLRDVEDIRAQRRAALLATK